MGLAVGNGPSLADLATDCGEVRHVTTQIVWNGLVLHRVDTGPGNRTATIGRNLIPVLTSETIPKWQQKKKEQDGRKGSFVIRTGLVQMER